MPLTHPYVSKLRGVMELSFWTVAWFAEMDDTRYNIYPCTLPALDLRHPRPSPQFQAALAPGPSHGLVYVDKYPGLAPEPSVEYISSRHA